MADYCTIDDIRGVIDDATILDFLDDDNTADVESDSVISSIEKVIEGACDEVDFFASAQVTTPFTEISGKLTQITTRLAVCRMFLRRPHVNPPPGWESECQRVYQALDDISEGKTNLLDPDDEYFTESELAIVKAPKRIFTKEMWETF